MTTLALPTTTLPAAASLFEPVAGTEATALRLRDAREADLPALLAIEAQFPGDRISPALFRRLLGSRRATTRVAEVGGRVVGFHVVRRRWFDRRGWLYSLAVDGPERRQGIGRRLLADAELVARRAGHRGLVLEVRQDNAAAQALYARAGYRPVKALRRYYDDGSDGWRHVRDWR